MTGPELFVITEFDCNISNFSKKVILLSLYLYVSFHCEKDVAPLFTVYPE